MSTSKTSKTTNDRVADLWRRYRAEISPQEDRGGALSEKERREAELERINPYYALRQDVEFVSR